MIPQRVLSVISNSLLRQIGGCRVPDQTIELDYALGWFLCEMSSHSIAQSLAFKGMHRTQALSFRGVLLFPRT
jgi:hypothetical protein